MDCLDDAVFFKRTPWSSKSSGLCWPIFSCHKPAPGPSFCLQLDASAAQAPSEPHMKNTDEERNTIQAHHPWKNNSAYQLYSHSGYHIQDPMKTWSTSILSSWPASSDHSTQRCPQNLQDLAGSFQLPSKFVILSTQLCRPSKMGQTVKQPSNWGPRCLRQQEFGTLKCRKVLLFYMLRSKDISFCRGDRFFGRSSKPNLTSCSERRCRIWATDLGAKDNAETRRCSKICLEDGSKWEEVARFIQILMFVGRYTEDGLVETHDSTTP